MVEQVKIAITRADGSLTIMSFVVDDHNGVKQDPTPANFEREMHKAGLDFVSWRVIQDEEIIQDRTFRNAWKDTGKIEVDMPKAREIHREHLRIARAPLLDRLDVEYIRADENKDNNKRAEIVAQKQALRDITKHPGIELAQTPEELKKVWF